MNEDDFAQRLKGKYYVNTSDELRAVYDTLIEYGIVRWENRKDRVGCYYAQEHFTIIIRDVVYMYYNGEVVSMMALLLHMKNVVERYERKTNANP